MNSQDAQEGHSLRVSKGENRGTRKGEESWVRGMGVLSKPILY